KKDKKTNKKYLFTKIDFLLFYHFGEKFFCLNDTNKILSCLEFSVNFAFLRFVFFHCKVSFGNF
ncbi:MAG: hypothetical protein E6540_04165, partial [Enterococcus sp.]|nr:hypothetical protein [Enterococcus sp.]